MSAVSLYVLSTQTDLRRAADLAIGASAPHLGIAAGLVLASVGAKAVRWRLLLGEPGLGLGRLAGASLVGYLFSTFLPLRAGELVRSMALRQVEGVALSRSLASIVVEKVFDVASLLLLLVLVALMSPLPGWASMGSVSAGLGLLALGALIVLVPKVHGSVGGFLERRWPAFGSKVSGWLGEFASGLAGRVWRPRSLAAIVGWSLAAWVGGAITVWLGLTALGIGVPPWAAVLVLVVTNLGMAVPSAPGYIGVYHYLVVLALSVYGIDTERALAAGLVLHLLIFGSLTAFGLVAMASMGIGLRGISGGGPAGQQPPDAGDRLQQIALDHLCQVPLHRAIVRTAEAAMVSALTLEPPVVDAGCGDGIFAALAMPGRADLGVDLDIGALREAAARRAHRLVVLCSLEDLPIASESVGSVVCNSVIEHVRDIDRALAELVRILRPGGFLVITTPAPSFTRSLLSYRVLWAVGLRGMAEAYGRWFNRISHHYHFWDAEVWEAKLRELGIELQVCRPYLGSMAMAAFEVAHYLEAFRLIWKRLLGRWVLFPKLARWSPAVRVRARLVANLCARNPKRQSGYIFLLGQKGRDA